MNAQQLKDIADAQFERQTYLKTLRESAQAKLIVAHNGGLFAVTTDLISFLSTFPEESTYLIDTYGNPVKVTRSALFAEAVRVYQEVMTEWNENYEKSLSIRRGGHV